MGFIHLLLFDLLYGIQILTIGKGTYPHMMHEVERKTKSTSPVVGGTRAAAGFCCCWWFPLGTRGIDAAGLSVEAGLSITSRARPRPTEGHKGKK